VRLLLLLLMVLVLHHRLFELDASEAAAAFYCQEVVCVPLATCVC
jgi:hypothetical protein